MTSKSDSKSSSTSKMLSKRGEVYASAGEAIDSFVDILNNPWSPSKPDGILSLFPSENYIMFPNSSARIANSPTSRIDPHTVSYGDGPLGSRRIRSLMADTFNRYFNPRIPVESKEFIFGNGVTSVNDMLGFTLLDEGDGILLGMPVYGAFYMDFVSNAHASMLYVNFHETSPFGLESVEAYEKRLLEARAKGINVRIFLLCNPHNPLGVCYKPDVLKAYIRLCAKYNLHLVSDEVYALSVFNTAPDGEKDNKQGFTSILSLDSQAEGLREDFIHVLYGLSKDFAAGGIRLGCVHSRSESFRRALMGISPFHWPSGPSCLAGEALLEDEKWVDEFQKTSREKLRDSYLFTTAWLRKEGISYFADGNSGFFIWIDLGPFLPKLPSPSSAGIIQEGSEAPVEGIKSLNIAEISKEEAEKKRDEEVAQFGEHEFDDEGWQREALMVKKFMEAKVVLAVGKEFRAPRPGFFRIIFAKERDELTEGLNRIKKALALK